MQKSAADLEQLNSSFRIPKQESYGVETGREEAMRDITHPGWAGYITER